MSTSLKEVNDKISKAQAEQMRSYFSSLEDSKKGKLKALNYDVLDLQANADSEKTNFSSRHLQTYLFSPEQNLKFYIRVSAYTTSPENSRYPNREVFSIEIYNKDLLDEWMKCEGMILMSRNNALEFGRNQKSLLTYQVLKLDETTEKMQTQGSKSVLNELNEGIVAQKDVSNPVEVLTSKSVALTPMAAMQFNQQPPLKQLAVGAAAAAAAESSIDITTLVRAKAAS